ncbi:MAG: hypothetical protein V3W41_12000 [Planctomycetota bacterium]
MSDDWYLNPTWNDQIAATFETGLERARHKEQYLRIQVGCLSKAKPLVTIEFPFFVATTPLLSWHARALEILDNHDYELMFAVDRFRWQVSRAIISAESENPGIAKSHALKAIGEAEKSTSRIRNHPSVGLVGSKYEDVIAAMKRYADV